MNTECEWLFDDGNTDDVGWMTSCGCWIDALDEDWSHCPFCGRKIMPPKVEDQMACDERE